MVLQGKNKNIKNCGLPPLCLRIDLGFVEEMIHRLVERRNYMTTNQVEYAKHLETVRHQKVSEGIEASKAKSQQLSAQAQSEQARIAGLQVGVAQGQLAEQQRANLEKERVNWWQAQEQGRHNLAVEQLQQRSVASTEKLNYAQGSAALSQAESAASQARTAASKVDVEKQKVGVQQFEAQTQRLLASIAGMNASTARMQAEELARHNVQGEILTSQAQQESRRHNIAAEQESHRHNVTAETAAVRDSYTNKANLAIRQQQADAATMNALGAKARGEAAKIQAWTGVAKEAHSITKDVAGALAPQIQWQMAVKRLLGGSK